MWILIAIILIVPYEFNPYLHFADSLLGVIQDFTAIKLLGMIGVPWAVLQLLSRPASRPLLSISQVRVLAAFLAVAVLSGISSGGNTMWLTKYFSMLIFFPIVLAAVRTEADLERVLKAVMISLLLAFAYSLRQLARFGGSRLGDGLTDPNYYASWIILALPLAFMAARSEPVGWKRMLWNTAGGLFIVNILMTASRGAFLGLVATLGMLVYHLRPRRRLLMATAAAGALVIAVLTSSSTLTNRLFAGFDEESQLSSVRASDANRLALFYGGLRMIAEHPILGVGLGSFARLSPQYTEIDRDKIAHNTYIEIAAELGIPVLLLFLGLLHGVARSLKRSGEIAAATGRERLRDWTLGLRIGLIGYMIPAIFLSSQYEKFFWLFVFLSIAIERFTMEPSQAPGQPARRALAGRSGMQAAR